MVRLSQPWVMRYPLIDWHGSNGNIAGDGPAAARYTEARLTKLSEDGLLNNVKKNNVDFIPNYDESLDEPVCLPSAFPNLLCNPNSGIGVAMACSWGCHNLNDVALAIYDYMDGLVPTIPAPDFPTGGLIINGNECPDIISKGRGTVKIRARYKVEGQKIIFYEVPYGETIEGLLTELGEVCEKKEIEGIVDAHDESNKKGIRIVVEVARGFEPSTVAERIYLKTSFQSSFSYNQVALVDKTPTELSLKDCCRIYVEHNKKCLVKELNFNLQKAKDRLEIVEGLLKALEDIDNIIVLIKSSENSSIAKERLIEKYNFTENQAKAILAMRLSSLTKLDSVEINKEAKELEEKIKNINTILLDEKLQLDHIKSRLEELVKKYGDERRTEITNIEIKPEIKAKKEVIPEDVVVVLTQGGDIKRIPKMSFKIQKKNVKGIRTTEENILTSFATNTLDTVMIFTSKGKMYKIPVDKIPVGDNKSKGINLNTIFTFEPNEKLQAAINLKSNTNAEYVVFFTKNGLIKKTKLEEYKNLKKNSGSPAIKLKEGDTLASVTFLKDEDVIVITEKGMSIRFETKSINPIGRVTTGRKAIKLAEGDSLLVGLPVNRKDEKKFVVVGSKCGNAVKVPVEDFSNQAIAGKGVKCIKLAAADIVINGIICTNDDNLLIIGTKHSKAVNITEIVQTPRDSAGRAIIKDEELKNLVKF
jgi:DNA gyrase subunit A